MVSELFRFEMNPWELVLRGSAMYWFLYLLFRFVLRRDAGSIAIADVLLLVLIADASQNAMAGGYTFMLHGNLFAGYDAHSSIFTPDLTEDVHDLIFFVLSRPNATLLMPFAAWENGRFLLRRFIHFLYMKVESDSVFFTDQGWFLCLF